MSEMKIPRIYQLEMRLYNIVRKLSNKDAAFVLKRVLDVIEKNDPQEEIDECEGGLEQAELRD